MPEFWGTDSEGQTFPVSRDFYIECLGDHGWYFVTTTKDLQKAIEIMACWRMVKNQPSRIVQRFKEVYE